jgi:hypothetical protein
LPDSSVVRPRVGVGAGRDQVSRTLEDRPALVGRAFAPTPACAPAAASIAAARRGVAPRHLPDHRRRSRGRQTVHQRPDAPVVARRRSTAARAAHAAPSLATTASTDWRRARPSPRRSSASVRIERRQEAHTVREQPARMVISPRCSVSALIACVASTHGALLTGSRTSSIASIGPSPRTSPTSPGWRAWIASSRSRRRSPSAVAERWRKARIGDQCPSPPAPPRRPAGCPSRCRRARPGAAPASRRRARPPPTAASRPPATSRSAAGPARRRVLDRPQLARSAPCPHWISSATSSIPCWSHSQRNRCRTRPPAPGETRPRRAPAR